MGFIKIPEPAFTRLQQPPTSMIKILIFTIVIILICCIFSKSIQDMAQLRVLVKFKISFLLLPSSVLTPTCTQLRSRVFWPFVAKSNIKIKFLGCLDLLTTSYLQIINI